MKADNHSPEYYGHVRSDVFHLLPADCRRVLEIGVGNGSTIDAVRKIRNVAFSAGVELSEKAGEIACAHVDEVVCGNIETMELPPAWTDFDVILCLDVLEHLVDPWEVVAKLHTRLKKGGTIVASIPNISYFGVVFPLLFRGKWELKDAGVLDRTHLRFFVRNTIIELLTSSGLKLVAIEGGGMTAGSKRWWANRLSAGLFERFLASQYLIAVKD